MRKYLVRGVVSLTLATVMGGAHALQPLITDDTGTQGAGRQQLEGAYTRERAHGASGPTREQGVVYTFGLSDGIDLYAAATHSHSPTASGWTNPVVGMKWRFFESEDESTSLAIKPELAFPVSASRESNELGTGKTSGSLTLILSRQVPFGAVHFNLGTGQDRYRQGSGFDNARSTRISVAPVWSVTEQLSLALDLGRERTVEAGQTQITRFTELGLIYAIQKDLDWALGTIKTRAPGEKSTLWTSGLTWRF